MLIQLLLAVLQPDSVCLLSLLIVALVADSVDELGWKLDLLIVTAFVSFHFDRFDCFIMVG